MNKIFAVDYDNTLMHLESYPNSRKRFGNAIIQAYVRHLKKKGWYIIVNTCRHDEGLKIAIDNLKKHNIPFDLINENHPSGVLKYGETRKIFCNRSLDDTQMGIIGWFLRRFC